MCGLASAYESHSEWLELADIVRSCRCHEAAAGYNDSLCERLQCGNWIEYQVNCPGGWMIPMLRATIT